MQAALARGAITFSVPVAGRARKVRTNVMLDSELIMGIDMVTRATGGTRSEFLATAARERLERELGTVWVRDARDAIVQPKKSAPVRKRASDIAR